MSLDETSTEPTLEELAATKESLNQLVSAIGRFPLDTLDWIPEKRQAAIRRLVLQGGITVDLAVGYVAVREDAVKACERHAKGKVEWKKRQANTLIEP